MKPKTISTLGFAAALLALDTRTLQSVQAQTPNPHYQSFPIIIDFVNDCTGEEIVGSGEVRIATSVKTDAAGGVHIAFQFRSDFTAIGVTSGAKYNEHDSANQTINLGSNQSSSTQSFTQTYRVNTEGGKNNLWLKERIHLTVNANGDITTFTPDEVTFVCK